MDAQQKLEKLKSYLYDLESVAIAFSSGVDSSFLLKITHAILGDKAIAITVRSGAFPQRELKESIDFCKKEGIRQIICNIDELAIEGFANNPPNRCYLCKKEIFTQITRLANENNIKHVAEGSNVDDTGDYRPGLIAIDELGIKSPLRHAGLMKNEIRSLSRSMGLPTWDKPSFACLVSRFPYGEKMSKDKLHMIEAAEQYLLDTGYRQIRVRHHGNLARIETSEEDFKQLINNRAAIHQKLKKIGYSYISVDLLGYRTGSMNETLSQEEKV